MVAVNELGNLCQLHLAFPAMVHEKHPGEEPVTLARLGDVLVEPYPGCFLDGRLYLQDILVRLDDIGFKHDYLVFPVGEIKFMFRAA